MDEQVNYTEGQLIEAMTTTVPTKGTTAWRRAKIIRINLQLCEYEVRFSNGRRRICSEDRIRQIPIALEARAAAAQ
jgi:hypothetical protein